MLFNRSSLHVVSLISALAVSAVGWECAKGEGSSQPGRIANPSSQSPSAELDNQRRNAAKALDTQVFDNRARFVPPSDLSRLKKHGASQGLRTREDIRLKLQTRSVTPDGKTKTFDLPPELQRRIFNGIQTIKRNRDLNKLGNPGDLEGASNNLSDRTVQGRDERVRITETTRYPFTAIGQIGIGCTGTLIGPRHVLTAGHCVYNVDEDKWYSRLEFSPGLNGSYGPYGTIEWDEALSVKGWTNDHDSEFDYGMIILKKDVSRLGWLGFGWQEPMPHYTINIAGYPGDKPDGTLWRSSCIFERLDANTVSYPCDTAGGMSGSGVYYYDKAADKRTIYAIHARGGIDFNSGTRINQSTYEVIRRWKAKY